MSVCLYGSLAEIFGIHFYILYIIISVFKEKYFHEKFMAYTHSYTDQYKKKQLTQAQFNYFYLNVYEYVISFLKYVFIIFLLI